jgi:hypothetical protein
MSCAEYERVPLKSRCSMKCVIPALDGVSSRAPAPIQKPRATDRTLGMRSVITRWPESRSLSTYFCTEQIVVAPLRDHPQPPAVDNSKRSQRPASDARKSTRRGP